MKAAVQVLRQADELKKRVTGDVLNDNDAWSSHQQLQNLYQQLLVSDLEFALDKKVEQDLWNYVFKNQINSLQNQTKNKKNPRLVESQDNLTWFLGAASGFYLELLQELCETFDLDLPCRRKGSQYGITRGTRTVRSNITRPHQHSCLYICQHCLVHLGDIARYRNQSRQAEAFYHHAAQLIPTNGQPYNQLAILEAAKGDKLSTVFYYVRSIAVKFPFPVASTNLQKMFSKIAIDGTSFEGKNKLSVYDYVSAFLQFHALAHLASNLAGAECLVKPLSANIMTLVATESLTGWKLAQMVAVNLFALTRALRGLETETDRRVGQGHESLTEEEQTVYTLILELMSSMLNGLLLLVYTMQDESALVSYYALPVINVILGWLRLDPTHLKTAPFTSKLQIWPSLCKLLNGIIAIPVNDWNEYKYVDVPLPEDWDLQGFLPLSGVHSAYKFKETARHLTEDEESKLRITRLIGHGKWLCEQEIYGVKLMAMTTTKDGAGVQFEAVTQQTPSVDLLMQLEEMSICSRQDAKMADANNGLAEDEDLLHASDRDKEEGLVRSPPPAPTPEERTRKSAAKGIIGNARGDRKTRQNVAMQTIVQRKNMHAQQDEEKLPALRPKSEGKQVTFKTPSPSPPASSGSTPPLPAPIQHQQQQQQQQHVQYPAAVTMGWANGIPHAQQTPMYPHYYQNFPNQKAYYQQQDGNMVLGNQTHISNFGGPTTRDAVARFNYVDQEGGGPMSYSKAVIQGRSVSPAFLNERPPPPLPASTANFNMMPPNIKDPATFGNRPATGPPPLIIHGPPPPSPPPPPPPPVLIPPSATPSSINLLAMQQQQQFGFPSPPPPIMPKPGGGLWRPQWQQPVPQQASPPNQMSWLHQFPPPPPLPTVQQQQQQQQTMSLEHMMAQAHQQGNVQGAEANAANQAAEGPEGGHAQYMYHLVQQQQQQHNQFAGVGRPYHLQAAMMVPPPQHAIWGGAMSSTAGGGAPPQHVDKMTPPNQQPQHTGLVTQLPAVTTTAPMTVGPHYAPGVSNRAREEYNRALDPETDSGGKPPSDILESNTYSLFSSSWSSGLNLGGTSNHKGKEDDTGSSNALQFGGLLQQGLQSLWSSSGPTPLEQLLEQQKRKREPVTK